MNKYEILGILEAHIESENVGSTENRAFAKSSNDARMALVASILEVPFNAIRDLVGLTKSRA